MNTDVLIVIVVVVVVIILLVLVILSLGRTAHNTEVYHQQLEDEKKEKEQDG